VRRRTTEQARTCHQFDSTFQIDIEGKGSFVTLAHLQPEYTVLLFACTSWTPISSRRIPRPRAFSSLRVPDRPFLRPPIMAISPAAFAIPDASNGATGRLHPGRAVDKTGPSDWLLATMSQPHVAAGINNFRAGMLFDVRTAGFDGQAPAFPAAATNYYVFWHALGSVAAYL